MLAAKYYAKLSNQKEIVMSRAGKYPEEIKTVSKPGRRVYASCAKMPRVLNGLGIAIVSTPNGVMTDHKARLMNVGGEVLCKVI